ncbi:hypothetical protein BU25DRAFT_426626 [Macroventuria anomochaeta]|uniref:Uncharacterized protein n=1 Tax=Macroventuria anomochaeta TaxID=301207 RepID=A0ACB6RH70_9PLEO|nr:uncharacterized protein BU25DRAFT_426626 [Macroventuria anomochaeta]KAF2621226.1 hypothetical protein BU25DRAFT_426626 [Macroventuria anomochaeta]
MVLVSFVAVAFVAAWLSLLLPSPAHTISDILAPANAICVPLVVLVNGFNVICPAQNICKELDDSSRHFNSTAEPNRRTDLLLTPYLLASGVTCKFEKPYFL